ncbi:mitochondrial import inner membrane translocase subunit TIM50-like isoform X2 [Zea mays]|uniref:mitochondrial import inner membrane translocase subunit TIM50-like isoform X2 n=1 Tax=Zea mays TaxID=4577 RepID=UPI0009AAE0DF|nr:mitochondrial import inner membrane translocase subunit TIM50-like isoform X2 [Zea mays]|eukprot:XP_020398263.1 mitochondrial import inner membrane translocase subunit TIM50-like isoform X2 [Zea mays]
MLLNLACSMKIVLKSNLLNLKIKNDTQLLDLIPFLEYVAMARPSDIRTVLASYQGHDVAAKFIERSKEHQRRVQEQSKLGRLWRR